MANPLLPTKAQLVGRYITKGAFRAALAQLIDWAATLGVETSFAVFPTTPNDLSVQVYKGVLNNNGILTTQAQQSISGFAAASVNPRIDIVVLDLTTALASRIAGSEAVSPVAPATPGGKVLLAIVGPFSLTTTTITSSMITDQRGMAVPYVSAAPVARSSNTILASADKGEAIIGTSTFTQTLTAAATLGAGWWVDYRNDGTGLITIDPNGAELIDGSTTITLERNESCKIICDGTGFKTVGRTKGWVQIAEGVASASASLDFTGLTGYKSYRFELVSILGSASCNLYLRVSTDNGSTFKSGVTDYRYAYDTVGDNGVAATVASQGQSKIPVDAFAGFSTQGLNSWINVNDLGGAGLHPFRVETRMWDDARYIHISGVGAYHTAGAINAVRFEPSAGNLASGTIRVFGLKA